MTPITAWQFVSSNSRAAVDALLAVLLAPTCVCCSAALEHPLDGPVCPSCWNSVSPLSLACQTRGSEHDRPSSQADQGPLCHGHTSRLITRVSAAGRYEGALREIIHAFKYGGRRSLAYPLAVLMREQGGAVLDGADAVVGVPLHPLRRFRRGFNQADDLAARMGLPAVQALRRQRSTRTQAELTATERRQNVHGAFAPRRCASVLKDAIVVVVDDVMTTGATLDACALALKDVGVREVRALTAARVVTRPH